jgi:hypothetical protein
MKRFMAVRLVEHGNPCARAAESVRRRTEPSVCDRLVPLLEY